MTSDIPPQLNLDARWDACHDLALRRCIYSSFAGVASAFVFFKGPVTRWATVAFATGLGVGSAFADCSHIMEGAFPNLRRPTGSHSQTTNLELRTEEQP
ncbi:hypothetical protein KP509_36G046700 [Ceratopteris richardii]|uniref:MICOS complex subunit MIC10 n=1 Tax=Ceratopteris richardii TaxID=49495 RepID=A0A8T2QE03_CERRI|nr:hypothetical protein KP509_36G046700 [Ceratopteris richardii]